MRCYADRGVEDTYTRMFNLRNLEHYSVTVLVASFQLGLNFEAFTLPLRGSPNMTSLEFSFDDIYSEAGLSWSPSTLFDTIKDVTLACLHTFRVGGAVAASWYNSFNSPSTDPLGNFFTRHPGLRKISLSWEEDSVYYATIAPESVETLFPSLTDLDAPTVLCGPVMASKLAAQLEYLATREIPSRSEPNLKMVSRCIKSMPRLRKLLIGRQGRGKASMSVVKRMLGCTPELEELEIFQRIQQPDELLASLRLVPTLHTLAVELARRTGVKHNAKLDADILALVQVCPKLRHVRNDDSELEATWDIKRRTDGSVVASML
ncbi:hypothetical protein FRC08_003564 [Ceratobasidium sp. 394]|nr:hypothetical protein FRC08_003564 [Ceratobasidium sp. 394]